MGRPDGVEADLATSTPPDSPVGTRSALGDVEQETGRQAEPTGTSEKHRFLLTPSRIRRSSTTR